MKERSPANAREGGEACGHGALIRRYMPELDVLRGLAILMVLLYHGFYLTHFTGNGPIEQRFVSATVPGWLGVNLFFVLSGFLITGILLDSRESSDYYRRFYLRRAVRLLPAFLLTMLVLAMFHLITIPAAILSFAFLANYSDALHVAGTYGVLWSLSVEEQFYLVWPAVVRRIGRRWLIVICVILCVAEPVLRWVVASREGPAAPVHTATFLIADNLAMGALVAVFARSKYGTRVTSIKLGGVVSLSALSMLAAGTPFGILHRDTVVGAALQATPWNLLFTGVLLIVLGWQSPVFQGRWLSPIRFLGYVSYGLYLFHLLFFSGYDWLTVRRVFQPVHAELEDSFVRFFLAGGASILVAWISRRYYEQPFLMIGKGRSVAAEKCYAKS